MTDVLAPHQSAITEPKKSKRVKFADPKPDETDGPVKPGVLNGMVKSFNAASNSSRALVISMFFITGASLFWVMTRGTSVVEEEEREEEEEYVRRVRFADEVEADEAERINAEELMKRQKIAQTAQIQGLLNEMQGVSREIGQVEGELQATGASLDSLTGDDKVSYDTNLSDFESEQSIDKAFMMKDDIDKKRQGMIDLQKELGMHRDFLKNRYNQIVNGAKQMGQQYQQMYGEDPPVRAPLAPTFQKQTRPGPPQAPPGAILN